MINTLYALLIVALSAYLFHYSLDRLFAKDLPWYLDVVGGIILSPIIIPVTVVCYVCHVLGLRYPLIQ